MMVRALTLEFLFSPHASDPQSPHHSTRFEHRFRLLCHGALGHASLEALVGGCCNLSDVRVRFELYVDIVVEECYRASIVTILNLTAVNKAPKKEIVVGIIGMGDMGKMYARRISEAGWK